MTERDFKGVWIPRQVWLDENLTMLEKGILTEIDSLDISDDGCWASNEYLAKFCQCSECKVSLAISKLVKLGYIRIESFDGRKRKIKSCLLVFKDQPFKKSKADIKKVKESNTSNNQAINTKNNTYTRKSAAPVFVDGFDDFWSAYPKHVAKQTAGKAWAKLKPGEELRETILADIRRRKDGEWKNIEDRYIPHPATYINQRRWEDETEKTTESTERVYEEPTAENLEKLW